MLHDAAVDNSLVEFAICIVGRWYESNLEWAGHSLAAARAGIPQDMLDDLLAGKRPNGTPEQMLVYDVCMDMLKEHRLSDALYARAAETFGERGIMDIIAALGLYSLVSMTINTFECKVAPGVPAPFKRYQ